MSFYRFSRLSAGSKRYVARISPLFVLFIMFFFLPQASFAQEYFWWVDSSSSFQYYFDNPLFSGNGKCMVGMCYDVNFHRDVLKRWELGKGLETLDTANISGYEVTGVSADGRIIIGNADGNDGSHGLYGYALKWTAETRFVTLPWGCNNGTPLGNDCSYFAWCADANGEVAGEGYVDENGYTRPWQIYNGSLIMLDSPDTISSGVTAISADGSTAAGYTTSPLYGSAPAGWLGGSLLNLCPFDSVVYGSAWYVANGGAVILGRMNLLHYVSYYFYYTPSTGRVLLDASKMSLVTGNADGSKMLGYDTTGIAIWDGFPGASRNLIDLCQNDYGMDLSRFTLNSVAAMSNDGTMIFGQGSDNAGHSGYYVMKLLRTISVYSPQKDTILVAGIKDTIKWRCPKDLDKVNIAVSYDDGVTKTQLASNLDARPSSFVWTVPDSQSNKCRIYITSVGDSLAGKSDLFTVGKDTFIVVTSPTQKDRWIAGDKDTVRWKSRNVQFVNISFSVNDGVDWWLIGWKVPADTSLFVWTVPDSLSTLCRIMIQSWTDTLKGVSDRFKVKGYVMTRFTASGQYEAFRQGIHDWNFGNVRDSLWPRSWWKQFNYRGTDPITGQPYPKEEPFLSADSSSFPDWPLLARAYGTTTCYWSVSPVVSYKEKAREFWKGTKKKWGGSCAGMAIGSLLAFDRKDEFRSNFTLLPDFAKLHDLTCADSVRLVINELWVAWHGTTHQQYDDVKYEYTPTQTLHDIQSMLVNTNQDGQYLYLANNSGKGAHAIVAYAAKADTAHPGHYIVSVYDNSYSSDYDAKIDIDTTANSGNGSWTYSNWAGWGGPAKLYLMDPSSTYLVQPVLPKTSNKRAQYPAAATIGNEPGRMAVYIPAAATVVINDSTGNRIGYDTTGELSEIPGAFPIMPPVSAEVPPFGYTLPVGTYTATMTGFSDSVVNVSLLGDSATYAYSRTDAKPGERDKIEFHGGVTALNVDSAAKNIRMKMIMSSDISEKVIEVTNMTMPGGDSVAMHSGGRSGVTVTHRGGAAAFDLVLRTASAGGTKRFFHEGVALDGNSSITIVPSWQNLDTGSVKILIDHGNTGTPNDSVVVTNEALGVNEEQKPAIPTGYALNQNYPNPFNPSTNIEYDVPAESHVRVTVYSILGQEIATLVNSVRQAGRYTIQFPAINLPAGVYFYTMEATGLGNTKTFAQTRKMVLIK